MIKDFKRGGWKTEVSYELRFFRDRDGGYAYPCDENGSLHPLLDAAKGTYAWCMAHPEEFPYQFNEVARVEKRYREPDTGTCRCGEKIELHNQYLGACECPGCGQWYSMSGQELLPPDEWEEYEDY